VSNIPAGWSGVRRDFQHYASVHHARTLLERLLLPLRAPSLLALAVYRYGRWAQNRARPFRLLQTALSELVRHLTGVFIQSWVEIEEEVWFGSFAPIILGASRVGRGSFIHGGVTLGMGRPTRSSGGTYQERGVPSIGRSVVIGPGAIVTGPVLVPDGSVVGPNTLLTNSLPVVSAWQGATGARWKRAPELLVPEIS
jgi:serine acetyltransferase